MLPISLCVQRQIKSSFLMQCISDLQLEPEDKVRIKKRKEQNKTAAKRFRIKKKITLDQQYTVSKNFDIN